MTLPDIQWVTLAMQIVILLIVGWSWVNAVRVLRANKRTSELIDAYRREIGWLNVRIDLMERKKGTIDVGQEWTEEDRGERSDSGE